MYAAPAGPASAVPWPSSAARRARSRAARAARTASASGTLSSADASPDSTAAAAAAAPGASDCARSFWSASAEYAPPDETSVSTAAAASASPRLSLCAARALDFLTLKASPSSSMSKDMVTAGFFAFGFGAAARRRRRGSPSAASSAVGLRRKDLGIGATTLAMQELRWRAGSRQRRGERCGVPRASARTISLDLRFRWR